jgi:hypothetical protein
MISAIRRPLWNTGAGAPSTAGPVIVVCTVGFVASVLDVSDVSISAARTCASHSRNRRAGNLRTCRRSAITKSSFLFLSEISARPMYTSACLPSRLSAVARSLNAFWSSFRQSGRAPVCIRQCAIRPNATEGRPTGEHPPGRPPAEVVSAFHPRGDCWHRRPCQPQESSHRSCATLRPCSVMNNGPLARHHRLALGKRLG